MLRKIYTFLFQDHDIGFMRFCYAMLIPCALSPEFCRWWMLFMAFVLALATHAKTKSWNKPEKETHTPPDISNLSPEAQKLYYDLLRRMDGED